VADEINLVCPSGAAEASISVIGQQFTLWQHHAADRSYWLIRVPLDLLPHFT
jgi:hypothetical protein